MLIFFELLEVLMSEQYSTDRADVGESRARTQERTKAIRCGQGCKSFILDDNESEMDFRVWKSFSLCRGVSDWHKILAKDCKQRVSRDINQDFPSNQWVAEIK